jgi:CRP-like cAMP-binding protein
MEDLGNLIDETRINVSRLLNDMQEKELIQLKRKEIYIPELEKLTQELIKTDRQ